ncbi:tyrosine--tRNA ligase [Alicyclobacillus tolerans]|uniref:tyrosine--tRNA ligase n=1 Tax=Alicyclobacillus tolerans TaxID=90970 RepID=UPI001F012873|nr:tyrosine--tRNA ligase [Alicyclobacillus tolerans]MCF8565212.1 tyrosine--tRNA ligase [Alicyclobacillus tolerans]
MAEIQLSDEQEREVERQLRTIRRGSAEIVPEEELVQKIRKSVATGTPLRVKLGLDPTAKDIHLGHTVVLQKIRQMQDLGHLVHLVIGDFTGRIGDPTDKAETRRQLTEQEVAENAQTYVKQVFKVLDPDKTEVVYNSTWLAPLTFADVVRLASTLTVARMLEREDFTKRFRENRPIHVHEFFYPLMQAYDSVALKSDIELGGTDQKFNLLMGRTLQKEFGLEQQVALMMPLLEGLDGVHKMSKSLGNYIGVDENIHDMFGKAMSIPDELMPKYFELVSSVSTEELEKIKAGLADGSYHPRDAKMRLAKELVSRFHGEAASVEAEQHWHQVFQQGALPEDIPEAAVESGKQWIVKVLVQTGLAKSNREGRRAVEQGGVRLNGEKVSNPDEEIDVADGMVIQVGKRQFVRCKVQN